MYVCATSNKLSASQHTEQEKNAKAKEESVNEDPKIITFQNPT